MPDGYFLLSDEQFSGMWSLLRTGIQGDNGYDRNAANFLSVICMLQPFAIGCVSETYSAEHLVSNILLNSSTS